MTTETRMIAGSQLSKGGAVGAALLFGCLISGVCLFIAVVVLIALGVAIAFMPPMPS